MALGYCNAFQSLQISQDIVLACFEAVWEIRGDGKTG